jgi:hypothetical protein
MLLVMIGMGSYGQIGFAVGQSTDLPPSAADDAFFEGLLDQIPRQRSPQASYEQWTTPKYNMILISPPTFAAESQRLADWQTKRGIRAIVVDNWEDFPGQDGPEKVRNAIRWYYDRHPIEWVLLMGDTGQIPIRYIYNPDCLEVSPTGYEANGASLTVKPTDYYYADLTGNWNIDGDGNWGERGIYNQLNGQDEWDWETEVYVGRLPADTVQELKVMIDKTIAYGQGIGAGEWMNRYMAASGISDWPYSKDSNGEDEAYLNQYIIDNIIGDKMDWAHFYEATTYYTIPPIENRSAELKRYTIRDAINFGFSVGIWAGHGAPGYLQALTISRALDTTDVAGLTNTNRYPFFYSDACSTAMVDHEGNLGEAFLLKENGGGIGFVGSVRISWYWPNDTHYEIMNRGLAKEFMRAMFMDGMYQPGKALYESKKMYRANSWHSRLPADFDYWEIERKGIMSYLLLGDPSIEIYTANPKQFSPILPESLEYYSGTPISIRITDTDGTPIPNARLTVYANDTFYRVFHANWDGSVVLDLPVGSGQFNYALFAHNMIYREGSFTVEPDSEKPTIAGPLEFTPDHPTVTDQISISINFTDNASGISEAYVLLSTDDFTSIKPYRFTEIPNTRGRYSVTLPKLEYGNYRYGIIAFDYANNWQGYIVGNGEDAIRIPIPVHLVGLIVGNIGFAVAISLGLGRQYRKTMRTSKLDDDAEIVL